VIVAVIGAMTGAWSAGVTAVKEMGEGTATILVLREEATVGMSVRTGEAIALIVALTNQPDLRGLRDLKEVTGP
jgi:hypothetical protein